jgi:hypothetical protein
MDKFCALLYGESGVGKTPFCGTLEAYPKTSPCLFLDVDAGSMSLDSTSPRPAVFRVETWTEMQVIYSKLAKRDWKGLAEWMLEKSGQPYEPREYKSVVIDSGTELLYKCRIKVMEETGNTEEQPTQPEYMKAQERMRKLYRAFRDLPGMSLVVTAGVRELKDDVAGYVKHFPDFQPQLTKDLLRMTDLVLFMNVALEDKEGKITRYAQAVLSQRVIARDRSGKLGPGIKGERLFWKDICEKILD